MKNNKNTYNETLKKVIIERDIELNKCTKKYSSNEIDIEEYALDISNTLNKYEDKVNQLIKTIFRNKLSIIN